MEFATPFALNSVGEPQALEGEARLLVKSDIDLYDGDTKPDALRGGTAILTSHRLLWHCPARLQRYAWDITRVTEVVEDNGGALAFLTRPSPKVVLAFAGGGKRLKLCFKVDGQKDMLAALAQARSGAAERAVREAAAAAAAEEERRRQEAEREAKRTRLEPEYMRGGSALQAVAERMAQEAKMASVLSDSFSGGLSTLVAKFEELQGMVDACLKAQAAGGEGGRGGSAQAAAPAAAGGGAADAAAPSEDSLIGGLLRDMGSVRNPVTREMAAGRDFAPALAREVAGFIAPRLAAEGGMMPLTDVYCLYSRARGMDTISPDDLLEAVRAMEGLRGLGLAPRTLPGGLRVLQLESLTEEAMVQRALQSLAACAAHSGQAFTTPNALATAQGMPAGVARQHLDTAVSRGAMAVDVSVAGKRYYANRFAECRPRA